MRHFFSQRAGKPERGGRGAPGREGTPRLPRRALSRKAGAARGVATGKRRVAGARGELSGKGSAWGCEGRRPRRPPRPEVGEGGGAPDWLPREPRARPRADRQGAQQAPGTPGRRSVASLRERKCGGPDWGPDGLGRAGGASRTRGPPLPATLLARLAAPPCGRLRGAATARAQCGLRGPRGQGVCPRGPQRKRPGVGPRPAPVSCSESGLSLAPHTPRVQPSRRKPTRTCPGSCGHLPPASLAAGATRGRHPRVPSALPLNGPEDRLPQSELPRDCHLTNKRGGDRVLKGGAAPQGLEEGL